MFRACAAFALAFAPSAQAAGGMETVYLFSASSPDYQLPHGDLVKGTDGSLYGTTVYGGESGTGSIYRIDADGEFDLLHSFNGVDASDANVGGAYPQAGLVFGNDGALYGTTVYGGVNGTGTVFRFSLGSSVPSLTTLRTFSAVGANSKNVGGAEPYAALSLGLDGAFYGSTHSGGAGGNGTIFRVTKGGQFSTLHEFSTYQEGTRNADGAHPLYRLAVGEDGRFYGAVENGGAYGAGAIFEITPEGSFATLHSFGGSDSEGQEPNTVTVGGDGALYGTTESSGSALFGRGSIFRYTPAEGLQTLYALSGFAGEGHRPYKRCALVVGPSGQFYGTALGDDGLGVVYRFVPNQSFEALYVFGSVAADLAIPDTTLAAGPEGKLYGTASNGEGEAAMNGGIFRFAPDLNGPVSLSITPATIAAGSAAQLTWSAPGFSYCNAYRSWTGSRGTAGSQVLSPSAPGTYLYQLSCSNQSGFGKGSKTVFLTVTPVDDSLPAADGESSGGALSDWTLLLLWTTMLARRRRQCRW